jgi:hypothetical protein
VDGNYPQHQRVVLHMFAAGGLGDCKGRVVE